MAGAAAPALVLHLLARKHPTGRHMAALKQFPPLVPSTQLSRRLQVSLRLGAESPAGVLHDAAARFCTAAKCAEY